MRHVQAVFEGLPEQLIPECARSENAVHGEFAGVAAELFKFQELELNVKG